MARAALWLGSLALALASACAAPARPAFDVEAPKASAGGEHPPGIWSDRYVSPSAYAHYIEARVHEEEGSLERALAHADLALSFDPGSSYLRVFIAELHLALGDRDRAREQLSEALKVDPESPHAQIAYGRLAEAGGDWAQALIAAQRALNIDPSMLEGHRLLARAHLAKREPDLAREALEGLVARWPEDVWATEALGRLAMEAGHADEAVSRYRALVRLKPRSPGAYLRLGEALERSGQRAEAHEAMAKCTRSVRRSLGAECWVRLVQLAAPARAEAQAQAAASEVFDEEAVAEEIADGLLEIGGLAPLEAFVRACEGRRASHKALRYHLGVLYQREGKAQQAVSAFSAVPQRSAFFVESQVRRVQLLIGQGKRREAQAAVKAALEVSPEIAQLHLLLAALHEREGRRGRALKVLEAAAQALPEDVGVQYHLALMARSQGQDAQALEALEKALRLASRDARVLGLLGVMVAEQGRELARAESLLERAREGAKTEDPEVLGALGWVLLRRGRYEAALDHLEEAARLAPDEPLILARLGDARRADGQRESALEVWQRALKMTQDKGLRAELRRKIEALNPKAGE